MLADCGSALHGGRFDIDLVQGPFGGGNFSAWIGRLDGSGVALLRLE